MGGERHTRDTDLRLHLNYKLESLIMWAFQGHLRGIAKGTQFDIILTSLCKLNRSDLIILGISILEYRADLT